MLPDEKFRIEWLAMEHYRIHVIELWPDGPRKDAALAAARSALEGLASTISKGSSFTCATCTSRRETVTVIPSTPPGYRFASGVAA